MFAPAATGFGAPTLVAARSQATVSGVEAVILVLFAELGSLLVVVTLADSAMGLAAAVTVAGTFTTTIISASAATARLAAVQFTFPVPPTIGAVQLQPAGASTDSNVVLAGVPSVKLRPVAVAGPLFVIVCVYVMLFPARTDTGVAVVLRTTSACVAVPTTTVAVAELAPKDWFAAFTVAVSLITVPLAVPAVTL